jgi:hypothetical protein
LTLARDQPDVAEVRVVAEEMVREARRAAQAVSRIRRLVDNIETQLPVVDPISGAGLEI